MINQWDSNIYNLNKTNKFVNKLLQVLGMKIATERMVYC